MLKVLRVISPYPQNTKKSADELFAENRAYVFVIEAPILWWIDVSGRPYGFDLSQYSENEIRELPLSTTVGAMLYLTYREIVEVCEDYVMGFYKYEHKAYQFPNENEWTDFFNVLVDVPGIRNILKEETQDGL